MDTDDRKDDLTEKIIGCAFTVANTLGPGFLEKVYENALVHELRKNGLKVEQQRLIPVIYDGVVVGDYVADLIVENQVLVELKAAKGLEDVFTAICINYLKASKLRRCLLINFGRPKIEVRRLSL
jgi:GxxExxY protein